MFIRITNPAKSPRIFLRGLINVTVLLTFFAEISNTQAMRRLILALSAQRHHDEHEERNKIWKHLENLL